MFRKLLNALSYHREIKSQSYMDQSLKGDLLQDQWEESIAGSARG